jgi:type IV pilus assembly protein PilV
MNKRQRIHAHQRGLGIIEVLVALVVVSFGVLGMASLQLTGMKHSTSGYNRSQALLFAENMATRIRINSPGVENSHYAGFDSSSTASFCGAAPVNYCQANPAGVAVVKCDAEQLATFDLFSVACGDVGSGGAEKGVNGSLPGGKLEVGCGNPVCSELSVYTITVTWTEGKTASESDQIVPRRVQMRVRP